MATPETCFSEMAFPDQTNHGHAAKPRASREKLLMCWSGGKDSSLALHEVLRSGKYEVAGLLTTVTDAYDRISMHGVRRVLLERQSESLGIPVRQVRISKDADNQEYERKLAAALHEYKEQDVRSVCFGDIFLEDLRAYRERNLSKLGMRGLFPLWKKDTTGLLEDFIRRGFKAVVTCVDTQVLDASFAGAEIDRDFRRKLPPHVDPCGENGEFHSFVYDGPCYNAPVHFKRGESVLRDARFCFRDLLPA